MDKKLKELVNLFEHNKKQYKGKHYDEAKTRADFIDKFFEILGWDIYNKNGYAEQYREVVREDKVEIKGKVKAPDYSFRVGGIRKFFVEAKKPSVDIKHDIGPAFQLRRYAYTAKLPLSILTDFEEFAVYDSRIKPDKNDKASTARIFYCTYEEYEKEAEFIFNTFSRDAILKGSFDKYIEGSKRKKGTSEVDKEFLKLIEKWREDLAKNLALRNKDLTIHELNYSVQKIIDRIIFLRIAEDRHTEEYGRIKKLLENKKELFPQLVDLFLKADAKYNSGLFDFKADQITPTLKIDDKVFKDIIKSLYYPDSPYEFSVFEVEILGNIYEQFLGKTIRLTAGHQAKIEDKPEVKKAGGVYYTPKYIVDYIVKNTVGEKIKNKTPEQIADLKIVDPACGSGSFLLGAYQLLLDYHLEFYSKEKNLKKALKDNKIYQLKDQEYRLTIEEKHKVLLNNIFGVDIDSQAVEVSKLSLLLKLLEGETQESAGQLFKFSDIKLLPDLSFNIKCGNSLIGSDFYESGQMNLFEDEETVRRINVFDWDKEFPEIFAKGGFDVVIGNPPYGFHQIHHEKVKKYFKSKFISSHGSFENYFLFYEASLNIINKNGCHGFIVPVTWISIPSALSLRKFVLDNFFLKEIVWLPEEVFDNASVNTLISIITKSKVDKTLIRFAENKFNKLSFKNENKVNQLVFIKNEYSISIFQNSYDIELITKIKKDSIELGDIAGPCSGYNPYEIGKGEAPDGKPHSKKTIEDKPYHSDRRKDNSYKPEIIGRNLSRYFIKLDTNRWIKYGSWLAAPRDQGNFRGKRILVQEITGGKDRRIVSGYIEKELYYSRDVIPIKIVNEFPHPFYLLSLINSKLFSWYHHKSSPKSKKGLFPKILVSDLKKLPIKKIDESNNKELIKHDRVVQLVDQMLEVQKKYHNTKLETEKNMLKKQIDILDNQIDQLVYKLYGLTEDEIKIVEGE